jgi:hypothetical protein
VLTSSFPADPPVGAPPTAIRVPLGGRYTATLAGTDTDRNPLTLIATGEGFDLTTARMGFTAQNGAGQANGTFSWEPTCEASTAGGLLVRFRLTEAGPCAPLSRERLIRFEVIPQKTRRPYSPPASRRILPWARPPR